MVQHLDWISTKNELPNPEKDSCILIWLPKLGDNPSKCGIPVICHYLEIQEENLFTQVNKQLSVHDNLTLGKGYYSQKGKVSYRPTEDFEFWKRCDFLLETSPPCSDMKNELLDTVQFLGPSKDVPESVPNVPDDPSENESVPNIAENAEKTENVPENTENVPEKAASVPENILENVPEVLIWKLLASLRNFRKFKGSIYFE